MFSNNQTAFPCDAYSSLDSHSHAPNAMMLFRPRRDFGITAAVIAVITVAAVRAIAAGIALSTSIQTASTLNNLSATVSKALDQQENINGQLKGGLMVANQRIDLVQEQIDVLWQLAQLGCEQKYLGLCVTSIQYHNFSYATNLSRSLSQYLLGNWSADFDQLMAEL